jgi:hypothetical protein
VLLWLLAIHRAALLGFPRPELWLWTLFDALMFVVLVRAAMRPRRARLVLATAFATADAVLSVGHLAWVGPGHTPPEVVFRALATIAPVLGAAALAWATTRTGTSAPSPASR